MHAKIRCECGDVRSLHRMSVFDIMLIGWLLCICRSSISISDNVWMTHVGCIRYIDYDFITLRWYATINLITWVHAKE